MENDNDKIIHPGIKDSRVLTYLNLRQDVPYTNTPEEDTLMNLWRTKYYIAEAEYKKSRARPEKLDVWRKAYLGELNKLNDDGTIGTEKMKAIRKLAYELVEGKINANIPAPKMSPRYHSDLVPVRATEQLIKHDMDKIESEEVNDESEHQVCIDGTSWFKVGWNPFDNTHRRSGNPIVTACPVDSVIPQPGIKNYKEMEYIFEKTTMSVSRILDMYNRYIPSPTENDMVPIINCYFLNEDRYVGKFTWCEELGLVLCNDLEWGIRKRRQCVVDGTVIPVGDTCPVCGGHNIKYVPVKEEILKEPLKKIVNPYRTGETTDKTKDLAQEEGAEELPVGTVIPHYLIRQLPFVPYKRISVINSFYGVSEVELVLENQDAVNKLLNKAQDKSEASQTWVTKLKDTRVTQEGKQIKFVEVESPQEGQTIQVKQVISDINEEMAMSDKMYEIGKSTVGITDTDQGKYDPTARSGKAKQLQMQASAQRNVSPNTMRNKAYAGVYELIFKNLLAYCDEPRSFVSLLPDGTQKEEQWSKYMFLDRDDNGELYYRDDFAWSVDTASDITEDRASMWQMIDNDFINGTMGTTVDPQRALMMYWQMKKQYGYPIADYAIDFLKDSQQHLPSSIEKVLVENPQAVQMALDYLASINKQAGLGGQTGGGAGGARPNSGPKGNGATQAANVEKTNNKNRAENGNAQTNTNAVKTGGMQGGVPNVKTGQQ